MMVRVEQGKGRKDRYTLLSHRALAELREYWKRDHPTGWLFPSVYGEGPMSAECASRAYNDACEKAGITRQRLHGIHTLRHCFASHLVEKQGVWRTANRNFLFGRDALAKCFQARFLVRLQRLRQQKKLKFSGDNLEPLAEEAAWNEWVGRLWQVKAKEPPPAPIDASPAERILRLTGVDVRQCPHCAKGRLAYLGQLPPSQAGPV